MSKRTNEFSIKLYGYISRISEENPDVFDFVDELSFYTVNPDDEDLNDGLKIGDILSTVLFSNFAQFLKKRIELEDMPDKIVKNFIKLIDEMISSNEDDLVNLVVTGVFEVLIDDEKLREKMRSILKGKSLENYNMIVDFWYKSREPYSLPSKRLQD